MFIFICDRRKDKNFNLNLLEYLKVEKTHYEREVMLHMHDHDELFHEYEDYRKWSIASIFVCFIFGLLAFKASKKTRLYNKEKDPHQAEHYRYLFYE